VRRPWEAHVLCFWSAAFRTAKGAFSSSRQKCVLSSSSQNGEQKRSPRYALTNMATNVNEFAPKSCFFSRQGDGASLVRRRCRPMDRKSYKFKIRAELRRAISTRFREERFDGEGEALSCQTPVLPNKAPWSAQPFLCRDAVRRALYAARDRRSDAGVSAFARAFRNAEPRTRRLPFDSISMPTGG
jgi:hypothetical protein